MFNYWAAVLPYWRDQPADQIKPENARLILVDEWTQSYLYFKAIIAITEPDSLLILTWHTAANKELAPKFKLAKSLKVLHLSYSKESGTDSLFLIAVDPENVTRAISIALNFVDPIWSWLGPTIEKHLASKMPGQINYDRVLPRVEGSIHGWDFWLFGVTDAFNLFGETFTFSNNVGFIMSTQQNRLSSLWDQQPIELIAVGNDLLLHFSCQVTMLTIFNSRAIPVVTASNPLPTFANKNGWINEQNACRADLGIQDIESTCYFYDIFDHAAAKLIDYQSLGRQVPLQQNQCDQTQKLQYNRYQELPLQEKTMRHACFPKQLEFFTDKSPPVTLEGQAMVEVDKENFQLNWIEKAAPELDGESWSVRIQENDDNKAGSVIQGFDIQANYKVARISHFNVDFMASRRLEYSFFPNSMEQDFKVNVTCWSRQCPSYIKQNGYSLYSDITNERVVSNAFVYFVEISQLSQVNVTKFTVCLNVTQNPVLRNNAALINITSNFWDWYAANRKNLPFYAPPTTKEGPPSVSVPSALEQTDGLGDVFQQTGLKSSSQDADQINLQAKLDPQVIEFINEWPDEDIVIALQEAKDRLKQKPKENLASVTLSQKGLLTVAFQEDIGLPSYLKKEVQDLLTKGLAKDKDAVRGQKRRLGLFMDTQFQMENQEDGKGRFNPITWSMVSEPLCYCQATDLECRRKGECEVNYDMYVGCDPKTDPACYIFINCDQTTVPTCYPKKPCYLTSDPLCIELKFCNPTIDPKCEPAVFCNSFFESNCQENSQEPADDKSQTEQPDTPSKSGCDPRTDKTCTIQIACDPNTDKYCIVNLDCELFQSDCQMFSYCDPATDPDCDYSKCDPLLDPSCNTSKAETDCNPSDPECPSYKKPEVKVLDQEATKVRICNPDDPQSECYTPRQVDQQTCYETQYHDEKTNTCVYYQIYFGSFDQLFDVQVLATDDAESAIPERRKLGLQLKKRMVSVTDREFVMQLEFANPIEINPRKSLKVMTNFKAFNPGITTSESEIPCIRQVGDSAVTQAVSSISDASKGVVITATIGTAILRTGMKASLSQLWGMINGIQFIIHIPCINLDFPSNSFTVLKQLIAIATFELPFINTQALKGKWKVEEGKVLTDLPNNVISSMDQLGYNDANISNTMGTVYLIILATILGLTAILVTMPFAKFKWCGKVNEWLRDKLLWNFVIRLLLEQCLETTFAVMLTFKYGKFSTSAFGTCIDYIVAAIMTLAVASLPVFMVIFYLRNFERWESEEFNQTYEAALAGLKKSQKSSLFYPVYFVLRRVLFCMMTLFLYDYVILQLTIHYALTMMSIVYLINFAPYEEPLEQRLELMNECFTVFIIDLCLLFTDLDSDPRRQYNWGFLLILAILICVGVHAYFLLSHMISQLVKDVKQARRQGWLKTFPSLQKVQRVLLVLTCRKKFGSNQLPEQMNHDENQDHKDFQNPSQMSASKEQANEDEEAPPPQLLLNPATPKQIRIDELSLSSVKEESNSHQSAMIIKPSQQYIEDLAKSPMTERERGQDHSELSMRSAQIAAKIRLNSCPQSVDELQEIQSDSHEDQIAHTCALVTKGKPTNLTLLENNLSVPELFVRTSRVDYEEESQVNSAILQERIQQLQVEPGEDEQGMVKRPLTATIPGKRISGKAYLAVSPDFPKARRH